MCGKIVVGVVLFTVLSSLPGCGRREAAAPTPAQKGESKEEPVPEGRSERRGPAEMALPEGAVGDAAGKPAGAGKPAEAGKPAVVGTGGGAEAGKPAEAGTGEGVEA
ncbi:MAG: hypothetical protein FJ109_12180, partial [Deltaproteobacteria bacterium]|nr:hypothetical protein [Deltaproteobacteria bacterium]